MIVGDISQKETKIEMLSSEGKIFLKNTGKYEFLLVACIALLITTILLLRTDIITYKHPNFLCHWDLHKYIYMATQNPFDFHIAPFCWRVVNSLLAKMLPFDFQCNFFIVIFVAPLYYTLNAQKFADVKLLKRTTILIIPSIVVLVTLRIAIPQMNNNLNYLTTIPEALQGGWGP